MKTVHVAWVLLFSAAVIPTRASNAKVDSLKRLLQTHTATDRAEVLWNIAYELFDVDNPQAVFYAERAYEEVWAKGDSLQIVKVGTTYGQLLRRVGKVDESIKVSLKTLRSSRGNGFTKYTKMLLNTIGLIYMAKEEFSEALGYHYQSFEIRQLENDTLGIIASLQNVGLIHAKLNDNETAYKYGKTSIMMLSGDSEDLYFRYGYLVMAHALDGLGKLDSARINYKLALHYSKSPDALGTLPTLHSCLAYNFRESQMLDSARSHAAIAIEYGLVQHDYWPVAISYLLLSDISRAEQDYVSSGDYLFRADSISRLGSFLYVKLEVLKHRAKLAESQGYFRKSTEYYKSYYQQREELYQGREVAEIRKVQLAFEERKNRKLIETQSSIMSLQQESITRHRNLLLTISALLVLVILLAIELYRTNKKVKLINSLLDERVVDRTKELSHQRLELKHKIDEHRIKTAKVSSELIGLVSTLSGFLHLARIDTQNQCSYLEQATQIASRIDDYSRKLGSYK